MPSILDVYLSAVNKDLKIMLDVIAYLEKLSINEIYGKQKKNSKGYIAYNFER